MLPLAMPDPRTALVLARKLGKPPRPVARLERHYVREMRARMRDLRKLVRTELAPLLAAQAQASRVDSTDRTDSIESLRDAALSAIARGALSLFGRRFLRERLRIVGDAISDSNGNEFRRVLRIPRGANLTLGGQAFLRQWADRQLDLIESIPVQLIDDLREQLSVGIGTYERPEVMGRRISRRLDIAERRAVLIARDQTLTANGKLTEIRHAEAGITEYVWSTSNDERVRDEHEARDGEVFSWDSPPPDGHPGEPINCRCIARPVLPE